MEVSKEGIVSAAFLCSIMAEIAYEKRNKELYRPILGSYIELCEDIRYFGDYVFNECISDFIISEEAIKKFKNKRQLMLYVKAGCLIIIEKARDNIL